MHLLAAAAVAACKLQASHAAYIRGVSSKP